MSVKIKAFLHFTEQNKYLIALRTNCKTAKTTTKFSSFFSFLSFFFNGVKFPRRVELEVKLFLLLAAAAA